MTSPSQYEVEIVFHYTSGLMGGTWRMDDFIEVCNRSDPHNMMSAKQIKKLEIKFNDFLFQLGESSG